jgi:hypothetical protein
MTNLFKSIALAAAVALVAPLTASAQAEATGNTYPSFSNGQQLPAGQVVKFDFTTTTSDNVYFLFSAPTVADAFVLTQTEYTKFQSGGNFSSPGGFRNQSGRQAFTLPAGNFAVGVKNTGATPLDYAFTIVSTKGIETPPLASGNERVSPGARITKSFIVKPGDKMFITTVAEGVEAFIIPPSEVNKFNAGIDFTPVTGQQILTDLASGSASGEVLLNEGTFHIAFRNRTNVTRPAIYFIATKKPDFTGGGPVNPPSDVVPFFDTNTDGGVGGTFDGETFRTRFNNRTSALAPSFLVSGTTAGQFVRVYASGVLIAQGVAGGTQLTLKANGRVRLEDGTFPITVSQFNGQTESEKVEFFDMVIDTLAPAPPDNLDLTDESDTGPASDDNVTSATTLTFTGTAEPLARVLMTAAGRVVGSSTVQADENGDWTYTLTNVTRTGKVKFAAIQLDTAGNASRSSPNLEVTLLKRPAAPGKPDLLKADKGRTVAGAVNTINPTPTFIGKAVKGNTITVEVDGIETQSVVVEDNGKWAVTLTAPLTLGEHTVRAKQTDLAGGTSPVGASLRIRVVNPQ